MEHNLYSLPHNCLLCGNEALTPILGLKDYFLSGEDFNILRCPDCGLLITSPVPPASKLSNYYASKNYISHTNAGSKTLFNRIYRLIRKYTHSQKYWLIRNYSKGNTILDIGCATGEFLKFCSDKGMQPSGIEPNEKARNFAISKYGLKIENEPELINFESDSFDIITLWHVLEHVPDINKRMSEIARLLNNNGIAFIALPNHASYDSEHYHEHWAAWDVPRHLYHFDRNSFSRLAQKHGFQIKAILPMHFDAYYVSLLSEKYMSGRSSLLKALFVGVKSNLIARFNTREYSSLIYVIKKA